MVANMIRYDNLGNFGTDATPIAAGGGEGTAIEKVNMCKLE